MSVYSDDHLDAQRDDTCPYCGGDGERQDTVGLINWDEPRWIRCGDCDGTGRIELDAYEAPYEAPPQWEFLR